MNQKFKKVKSKPTNETLKDKQFKYKLKWHQDPFVQIIKLRKK